jgi:pyruvate,water dikinase
MIRVAWFDEVPDEELAISAGGKGASLCRMFRAGLPVPEGFIVCSETFSEFIVETGLRNKILDMIKTIDWNTTTSAVKISAEIQQMIYDTPMPDAIKDKIKVLYDRLGNETPVAVRSSGTAEDLDGASFAGQMDSFLFVIGYEDLYENIKKCWASLFNDRALFYRRENDFKEEDISVAVVVQKMVNSQKAGVMFSCNPINGDRDSVVIEAAWGLGEAVVSGIVTPDNYWINKNTYECETEFIAEKEVMVIRESAKGGTVEIPVADDIKEAPVLSEEEKRTLVDAAKKVEAFYGKPEDLEWGFEADGKFYLLQSRPITTL